MSQRNRADQNINICERERRKRYFLGYLMLGIALVSYTSLLLLEFPWRYSLSLILPLALMYLGFLQAREST